MFLYRAMPQIQGAPAQALIPTNSLSNYHHCADSGFAVCKSVSQNSMRRGADKIKGSIQLFDNGDGWWKNKLIRDLPDQMSCIYCSVFDLL